MSDRFKIDWHCSKCHRVFRGNPKCCGAVEEFDYQKARSWIIGHSNAWISIRDRWMSHPGVKVVADEWAESGNSSSAGILNDWISRLIKL